MVDSRLSLLEKSEVSSFIYTPSVPRVALIMALNENPRFLEYVNWAVKVYGEMAGNEKDSLEFKLKEIIERIKVDFSIDNT